LPPFLKVNPIEAPAPEPAAAAAAADEEEEEDEEVGVAVLVEEPNSKYLATTAALPEVERPRDVKISLFRMTAAMASK
jgi:hypothetical protein